MRSVILFRKLQFNLTSSTSLSYGRRVRCYIPSNGKQRQFFFNWFCNTMFALIDMGMSVFPASHTNQYRRIAFGTKCITKLNNCWQTTNLAICYTLCHKTFSTLNDSNSLIASRSVIIIRSFLRIILALSGYSFTNHRLNASGVL
jgi:hypothetical protein